MFLFWNSYLTARRGSRRASASRSISDIFCCSARSDRSRLADLGGTPFVMSPAELSKFIAEDTEKWAKLIREADIKRQ